MFFVLPTIVPAVFSEDYLVATTIFPIVAYACMLNVVFMASMVRITISAKTHLAGAASLGAVLVNAVANIVLIPEFGFEGAAIGTAVASLIQVILGQLILRFCLGYSFQIFLIICPTLWLFAIYLLGNGF